MDASDLELRNLTYGLFVELGRGPTADEAAERRGVLREDVLSGWGRLHAQHAIVLEPGGESLRMANPFSAVPTVHRVRAAGRWWYANCAWDAFGICAALHGDGRIETSCADCLVPAARWWDDIVFT
jgi:Alkylmercury lyase